MDLSQRLRTLRAQMAKHQLDAWVLPSSDPHNSEYMPQRWKVREYMSGFTASVSTMVVFKDSAYVWADGRYWQQAEQELAGTEIQIIYFGKPDVLPWNQWLAEHLPQGARLGFYGATMMVKAVADIQAALKSKNITVMTEHDLVDAVWQVAVIRGQSLIINLPGQPKSIAETLEGLKDDQGQQIVHGIFAAVPYCIDLIGGPYLETHEAVCKAFRPKSAVRPPRA